MSDDRRDDETVDRTPSPRAEKRPPQAGSLLDGLDRTLPALERAFLMQERCSRVGFDWNDPAGARDKLVEELGELDEALASPHGESAIHWEMGDLLLAATNLARLLGVDSTEALQQALDRFAQRFRIIEETLSRQGRRAEDATLEELESLWQAAKSKD